VSKGGLSRLIGLQMLKNSYKSLKPSILSCFRHITAFSPCLGFFGIFFLSARKADLKKGFQHLVVLVVLVVLVGTRVKKGF
jgi:hypothetical protein